MAAQQFSFLVYQCVMSASRRTWLWLPYYSSRLVSNCSQNWNRSRHVPLNFSIYNFDNLVVLLSFSSSILSRLSSSRTLISFCFLATAFSSFVKSLCSTSHKKARNGLAHPFVLWSSYQPQVDRSLQVFPVPCYPYPKYAPSLVSSPS